MNPHLQALEAEQAVLGAALISATAVSTMLALLEAGDFYFERHRLAFAAVASLDSKGNPVDLLSVPAELERTGDLERVGGTPYLGLLSASVPTVAHLEHYARIVAEKSTLRKLLAASHEIRALLTGEEVAEVDEVVSAAEQAVLSARSGRRLGEWHGQGELAAVALEAILTRSRQAGLSTGLGALDWNLHGLKAGNLIVVAARPSVGKSAFMLHLARHNAGPAHSSPVAIFSLEMSREELTHRQQAHAARINSLRVTAEDHTDAEQESLARATGLLGELPIEINDQSELDIEGIRALARRWRSRHREQGLILIDYLQRIAHPPRTQNENTALEAISRGCKSMARELECPVVALSQLSRLVERREDKRPMLSDLRGSGGIEQEADVVMTLYRKQHGTEEGAQVWPQRVEIGLPKNRNGVAGVSVSVQYDARYGDFTSLDFQHSEDDAPPPREDRRFV